MAIDLSQGRDVALQRNPANGKFDVFFATSGPSKGNWVLDSTQTHAVLTTLVSRRRGRRPGSASAEGGYYFDRDNRRGTLLWTVTQDRMTTPSQLQAFAEDGLQQLADRKQIANYRVTAQRVRAGQFRVDVSWSLPDGLRVPPLSFDLR